MISTLTRSDSHERAIERENALVIACQAIGNREQARKHWLNMVRMISERSPERVRRMEIERGIT